MLKILKRKKFIMLVILLSLIFVDLLVKITLFKDTQPGIDQVFYINWFQDLRNSNHFFPIINGGIVESLIADNNSFLNQYMIKFYNSPDQYFRFLNSLSFFLASFILGNEIIGFNISSIIFSELLIVYFSISHFVNEKKNYLSTIMLILLIITNKYLFFFSSLGTHNIGIFALLLFINFFKDNKHKEIKKIKFNVWIFGILIPFYFHIFNAFIITIFIFYLHIININKLNYKNIKIYLFNFIIFILLYLPFIILSIFSNNLETMISFSAVYKNIFNNIVIGGKNFIFNFYKLLNPLEWALLIIGISNINVIRKNKDILIIFFISFLLFIFIPGFNTGWERTLLYTYMPVLFLIQNLIIYYQNNKLLKKIIVFLFILIFSFNILNIVRLFNLENNDELQKINPKFINTIANSDDNLKNTFVKIKGFNSNKNVFFYNYHSLNLFNAHQDNSENKIKNYNNNVIIKSITNRLKINSGETLKYISNRKKTLPQDNFFIFSFVGKDDLKKNDLEICQFIEFLGKKCSILNNVFYQKVNFSSKYIDEYFLKIDKVKLNEL